MGPNPLNLPLRGIIGQDIIVDESGNQVAYRCGTIWPGPGIWSRFNDQSHPDGFLKVQDSGTGVSYWVKPYTGTVANGKWVSWKQQQKGQVSSQVEKGNQGRLVEKEAEEKLMKQVQLDMMRNLFGSLPTLPRPDPSQYNPTE